MRQAEARKGSARVPCCHMRTRPLSSGSHVRVETEPLRVRSTLSKRFLSHFPPGNGWFACVADL